MKIEKSDGLDKLTTEIIKYAHPKLFGKLSMLFTACCKHGVVPSNLCYGRITAVSKIKNMSLGIEDYRPIITINVLAKVSEYFLLYKLQRYVNFL